MSKPFYALFLMAAILGVVAAVGCQSTGGSYRSSTSSYGSDGHAGHNH